MAIQYYRGLRRYHDGRRGYVYLISTSWPKKITLTAQGMRFSLQTREIIADSIETVTCAQHHDACIAIPGCDKNMPGVIMAFARHNRPSIMVYGGSIKPGYSETLRKPINISTCYEAHGAYIYKTLQGQTEGKYTPEEIMEDIEQNACPGAGACGGMYTANTMSTSIEGIYNHLNYTSDIPTIGILMFGSNGTDTPELFNHSRRISRKDA
jgi:dihydroxy-acid dehydratase